MPPYRSALFLHTGACVQICGFAVPRGWGRGILNLKSRPLPERIPLTVVVGEPLRLPPFSGERGALPGWALTDALSRLAVGGGVCCCCIDFLKRRLVPAASPAAARPFTPPSALHRAGDPHSEEGRAVVGACHARYCAALQELYDRHKDEFAPNRKQDLRLVE